VRLSEVVTSYARTFTRVFFSSFALMVIGIAILWTESTSFMQLAIVIAVIGWGFGLSTVLLRSFLILHCRLLERGSVDRDPHFGSFLKVAICIQLFFGGAMGAWFQLASNVIASVLTGAALFAPIAMLIAFFLAKD
jgi:hypothetical protein